ncbi:MAG: hypothetical protein COT85_05540 [Chlamydiae bacterium CG10_big_fil_rev_8_21_14_0_10_42_34]|nr:MAG: hypothetical protein COT85_05540 [Chlamydiae bacterium CG10_big_fil_rev_8_21_14_0_10_42_34]
MTAISFPPPFKPPEPSTEQSLNIQSLPPEIIGEIGSCLTSKDIRAAAVAARQLSQSVLNQHVIYLAPRKSITDNDLAILVKNYPNLIHLDLENQVCITNDGLAHLQKLNRLTQLNLSGCKQITGAGLAHLQPLTELEDLNLSNCNISDNDLVYLQPFTKLKELKIDENYEIKGPGLVHLQHMILLEVLNISWCDINDESLFHLRHFLKLVVLDLSRNTDLTGAGLVHLRPLTLIEDLSLNSCDVNDEHLIHLQHFSELDRLDLTANANLTGAGLAHLQHLPNLNTLILKYWWNNPACNPGQIALLTQLRYLNLSNCYIRDENLVDLYPLANLETLEFSECRNLTPDGLILLQQQLPNCRIFRRFEAR